MTYETHADRTINNETTRAERRTQKKALRPRQQRRAAQEKRQQEQLDIIEEARKANPRAIIFLDEMNNHQPNFGDSGDK